MPLRYSEISAGWMEGEDKPSDRNVREYVPGCDRADAACMVRDWWIACISCPLSYAAGATIRLLTQGRAVPGTIFIATESGGLGYDK